VLLKAGAYDAVLLDANGKELARAPFWMEEPGAVPTVGVDHPNYADNEAIVASWKNAPGNRRDWLGIYKAGDPDQMNYVAFRLHRCGHRGHGHLRRLRHRRPARRRRLRDAADARRRLPRAGDHAVQRVGGAVTAAQAVPLDGPGSPLRQWLASHSRCGGSPHVGAHEQTAVSRLRRYLGDR